MEKRYLKDDSIFYFFLGIIIGLKIYGVIQRLAILAFTVGFFLYILFLSILFPAAEIHADTDEEPLKFFVFKYEETEYSYHYPYDWNSKIIWDGLEPVFSIQTNEESFQLDDVQLDGFYAEFGLFSLTGGGNNNEIIQLNPEDIFEDSDEGDFNFWTSELLEKPFLNQPAYQINYFWIDEDDSFPVLGRRIIWQMNDSTALDIRFTSNLFKSGYYEERLENILDTFTISGIE